MALDVQHFVDPVQDYGEGRRFAHVFYALDKSVCLN
jgi:hypothetical protein